MGSGLCHWRLRRLYGSNKTSLTLPQSGRCYDQPQNNPSQREIKMKQMKKWQRLLLACFFLIAAVSVVSASGYDYPISDPYEAAILGTPAKDMPSLPDEIRVKDLEMTVFPDRKIPEVFWYGDKLRYSPGMAKGKSAIDFYDSRYWCRV